jgi:hypothetical protein
MGLYYTAQVIYGVEVEEVTEAYYNLMDEGKLDIIDNDMIHTVGKASVYINDGDVNIAYKLKFLSKEEKQEVEKLVGRECDYFVVLQLD